MKKFTHFALAAITFLLMHSFLNAQTIAEYELTVDGSATTLDPNVSATDLQEGPNVGSIGYSSNGATANGWPLGTSLISDSYYLITVSPNAGYEMNITDINFGYRRSGTGPLQYELYWSTDGVLGNSTLLDAVSIPNNTDPQVGSLSGLNIDIADGETLYLKWYAYDASNPAGTFRMDVNNTNLQVEGTVSLASTNTGVFFNGTSAEADENGGTTDLNVSIVNEDAAATSVDVVLISGDASRVNGFTSQTVTFPGSSSTDETVTLTLTDNGDCEANPDLVFELQNASGGNNAGIISPSQFTLTVIEDDQTANSSYSNDFEDNNLDEWTQDASGDWTTSTTSPIGGTYSMKHNLSGVAGNSAASTSLNDMTLTDFTTVWSFEMKNGSWDPSGNNNFWVYLASSSEDLLPASNTTGYAVGINFSGNTDLLTLYRVDAGGTDVPLIQSTFDWGSGDLVGIRVTRDKNGEWNLEYDTDGGFDNLVSAGVFTDLTFTNANFFGPVFNFTSTRAGEFWLDNITVTQSACVNTYYSQSSGNFTDNIWDVVTSGTPGSAEINRYNSFVIQAGHDVVLDGDVQVNDLTIENTASFDLANSQYALGATGSWTNNGTLDAGDGKVYFFGTGGTYSISGANEFFDLEVDLLGDQITLNDNTDIWGTLTLSNGEIDVNGNVLTLRSDATTTAAVAPVDAGSVTGNITVERYIQNGVNSWRNLGASVSGATLQDWNDHFTTTGFPGSDYPNWPTPANRFPNIKSYDETDLGDREIGWRAATGITNTIGDGQGFWMYIGGSELPNTVDVDGTLITGDQTLNLDYTPDLGAFHDGWNMVSNLYAATIDWDSPDFGKSGLEDGIWIWNQDNQQYGSYISGVSTHSVTNEIAHSQSFWVHANAASPSLTFREAIKTTNNNADWIKSNEVEQGIARLKIEGNGYYDETVLAFNPNATSGYEGTHDAMKFYSANELVPSLATVVDAGEELFDLAINSLDVPEGSGMSIPLKALAGENGDYTLSVSESENLATSMCIYIEDLQTGDVMLFEPGASMEVALDTAQTDARFIIHISGAFTTDKQDNTCNDATEGWLMAEGSGEGPWTYTWTNSMGDVMQVSENLNTSDTLSNLEAGFYAVEISGSDEICGTRSEELMIFEPPALSTEIMETAATCNVEMNGEIAVEHTGGSGTWNTSLYQNGELIAEVNNTNENALFTDLGAGEYQLVSDNSCGTVESTVILSDENSTIADFSMPFEEISIQEDGGTVMLTNTSQNAVVYAWDMGDGSTYLTQNVTHTYTAPGEYEITLYSVGDFCEDMITKTLTVSDITVGIEELNESNISVWYDGQQVVVEHPFEGEEVNITMMNILGKTILSEQSFGSRITLPLTGIGVSSGVYLINIKVGDTVKTRKVVVNK